MNFTWVPVKGDFGSMVPPNITALRNPLDMKPLFYWLPTKPKSTGKPVCLLIKAVAGGGCKGSVGCWTAWLPSPLWDLPSSAVLGAAVPEQWDPVPQGWTWNNVTRNWGTTPDVLVMFCAVCALYPCTTMVSYCIWGYRVSQLWQKMIASREKD